MTGGKCTGGYPGGYPGGGGGAGRVESKCNMLIAKYYTKDYSI